MADSTEVPPIDNDYKEGPQWSARAACDALRDLGRQAENAAMALVPAEVTGHLVNAQKELLLAGKRLGEVVGHRIDERIKQASECLDEKAQRAREIHERLAAEKAARRAAEAQP